MYQYPYGNAQQLNLDWLMEQWQVVKENIDGSLQGEIDRVEAAITDLLAARDAAVAAAGAANTSAGAAAASAQAAAADAATATAQAAAATQERVNAAQAANNAQSYAGTAQTQSAAAQNAAGQAAASASQASGSAVNAAASAAGALQNFQLSDAARQAAQAAEQDAEAAATLLQPPATSADIGKALIVKTVGGGTVTAYELGEGGTPAIVNTIEDVAIASFDDGTVNPVQQLVVDIEPVQAGSGDPAPDNVRPITGWTKSNVTRTGKNIIKMPTISEIDSIPTEANLYKYIPIRCKPNSNYYLTTTYLNGYTSVGQGMYILVTPDKNNIPWKAIMHSIDGAVNGVVPSSADGIIYIAFSSAIDRNKYDTMLANSKIQLELGSIATAYEPYSGTTLSITFPDAAGTVYGGTLTINEDGSGALAITDANIESYNGETLPSTWISDRDVYAAGTTPTTGAQVVYKLSTPITYSLTSQQVLTLLNGVNNIWADTGNINLLKYYANSKTYIDEQNTLVKALIAPVLDSMVADTALTANDFRIVNNTLYSITTSVASGATLTPNTNCTATTIGAILKTLLT